MNRFLPRCAVALALAPTLCLAGARHFTFLYEATTSAPGSLEMENTITWAHGRSDGARFDEVSFREELEIGVTDHLQVGIYPGDWAYHRDASVESDPKSSYDGGAIELIYNLTNPVIDPIGLALYQEISAGRRRFELESKLIAQKNIGPLILAYNATLEAQWAEEGLAEHNGELQQSLGASYEISPRLSVGLELLHEFAFPDWRDKEKIRNFFIGPNVALRRGAWFATITALGQATDTEGEPDLQVRTIFGLGF